MYRIAIICLLANVAAIHGAVLPSADLFDNRIIGGEKVSIEDYPYQLALFNRGLYTCGGVILSTRWTITAAHCIGFVTAPESFQILTGTSLRNSATDGVWYTADRIVVHEKYSRGTLDYDVALLRISEEIVFGPGTANIAYHGQDEGVAVGEKLRVSGWGTTRIPNDDPFALRAVDVLKVDQELCQQQYSTSPLNITDSMLCAGWVEGGRDACSGDSGGPLTDNASTVLVGLVSWGRGCAEPDTSGVYARVASFSDWITSNIEE